MGFEERIAGALLAALAIAALIAGCGGGSSSSGSSTSSSGASSPNSESTSPASESSGGSEPSAEFFGPTGKNQTAEFGEEASDEEREAASEVLEENLEARAAGDWKGQCDTLSAAVAKNTAKQGEVANVKGCAASLELLAQPPARTKAFRANTMTGPIDALRVEGNDGFALYHGAEGQDYSMQMEKEDGEWKVSSLSTRTLP
jgi:hypothetical protein